MQATPQRTTHRWPGRARGRAVWPSHGLRSWSSGFAAGRTKASFSCSGQVSYGPAAGKQPFTTFCFSLKSSLADNREKEETAFSVVNTKQNKLDAIKNACKNQDIQLETILDIKSSGDNYQVV
jgi:hypothetical protein